LRFSRVVLYGNDQVSEHDSRELPTIFGVATFRFLTLARALSVTHETHHAAVTHARSYGEVYSSSEAIPFLSVASSQSASSLLPLDSVATTDVSVFAHRRQSWELDTRLMKHKLLK